MKQDAIRASKRKSVNLSLDTDVVAAARQAGLNLPQFSQAPIRTAPSAGPDRAAHHAQTAAHRGGDDTSRTRNSRQTEILLECLRHWRRRCKSCRSGWGA